MRKNQIDFNKLPRLAQILIGIILVYFLITLTKTIWPEYTEIFYVLTALLVLIILTISLTTAHKRIKNGSTTIGTELLTFLKWLVSSPNSENNQSIKTHPLDNESKFRLLERVGHRCEVCNFRSHLEVHHIIPRYKGGNNSWKNLIVLCPNCHTKADKGGYSRSWLQWKAKNRWRRRR